MAGVVDLGIAPPDAPEVEGPPLDHDTFVPDDVLEEGATGPVPHVDESMVRGLLRSGSGMVNLVAGDSDVVDHWRFTAREVDELAPPLTRYLNRNARLRAVAVRGDEAAMALVMAGYVGRNMTDQKRAQRAREERDGLDQQDPGGGPQAPRSDARSSWGAGPGGTDGAPGARPDGRGLAG